MAGALEVEKFEPSLFRLSQISLPSYTLLRPRTRWIAPPSFQHIICYLALPMPIAPS
jgi:hypothetical protein